jgi:hypothetical protein
MYEFRLPISVLRCTMYEFRSPISVLRCTMYKFRSPMYDVRVPTESFGKFPQCPSIPLWKAFQVMVQRLADLVY